MLRRRRDRRASVRTYPNGVLRAGGRRAAAAAPRELHGTRVGRGGRGYGPDPYPAQRLRQPPTGSRLCTDNYYYYILHERTVSPADTAQTRVQTRAHAAPPTVPPTPLAVTDVAIPGGTSAGRTPIDSIEFICDSSADPVCRCPSSTPVDPAVCCSRQPSIRTVIIGYR